MTIREALQFGERMLSQHRCVGSDPKREPLALLSHAADMPQERLFTEPEAVLDDDGMDRFARFLQRRLKHEPVAQIIGTLPFLGREFTITRDTLVPRPATEAIADIAVRTFAALPVRTAIDVGTGCGCIALSLAGAKDDGRVIATDISAKAIGIAKMNADRHDLNDRVEFRAGDLLLPCANDLREDGAVVLIANLPYIPYGGLKSLAPDVFAYEPSVALFGGPDGLDLYRRMLDQIAAFAEGTDIRMFIELLPDQYDAMFAEIGERFPGSEVAEISYGETIIGLAARLDTVGKEA